MKAYFKKYSFFSIFIQYKHAHQKVSCNLKWTRKNVGELHYNESFSNPTVKRISDLFLGKQWVKIFGKIRALMKNLLLIIVPVVSCLLCLVISLCLSSKNFLHAKYIIK